MKPYKKLLLFVLLALAAAAIFSPWLFQLWNSYASSRRPPADFDQVFSAIFIFAGVALLLASPSFLRPRLLREAGLAGNERRNFFYGFILAVLSMALLAVVMYFAGALAPGLSDPLYAIVRASGKALITALLVGFLEEIFFRGLLFKGLMEDYGGAAAFIGANLLYAAAHFFKAPEHFVLDGMDPLAGFRFLVFCLAPYLDTATTIPGLIGLFIIGVVLSYALLRSGSLYLSIGLHAGWVFAIKTLSLYGDFTREGLGWAFGAKPKLVSGVVTWLGILLVGAVVRLMTRNRT
ncbi:MAG TPA: CPBP family glutamic-type intramembrane protease [Candidatus Binatia bacterium]